MTTGWRCGQLGVAGLLWFQAMMATMATWPEFNIDLSPQLHTILRWVALFLTTPIVFYSCAPFFRGALRDLRSRQLTMDVSVSLAIGAAYGAGIWTNFDAVRHVRPVPDLQGVIWNVAPASARLRPPRN